MSKNKIDIKNLVDELGIEMEEAAELYRIYIDDTNNLKSELISELDKCDYAALERVVHSIKGSSGNLQINDVYERALNFDNRLKKMDVENSGEEVKLLVGLIEKAEIEIKEFFMENGVSL